MSLWKFRRWQIAAVVMTLFVSLLCAGWAAGPFQRSARSGYRVVAQYPHDPTSFTQGLLFYKGHLIEGTGQHGESRLLRVNLQTGQALAEVPLPSQYFGEGVALANGELFQLTWKNRVGFVYDPDTFQLKRTVRYAGEGWGLTFDGQFLVMSDGSATLRFLDPQTFQVTRRVIVREGNQQVKALNELEYVNGEIWANIWYGEQIARINPRDGRVLGWIDLRGLKPSSLAANRDAVYNGIAYDPDSNRLFVTGKNWPVLYEIQVVPLR